MTLLELKKTIHEKVDNLNDSDYLEILNAMIDYKDKTFQIPEEHLASIIQGEQDIKNGDFLTEEEFIIKRKISPANYPAATPKTTDPATGKSLALYL